MKKMMILTAALLFSATLHAQARLDLRFSHLESLADETVDVNLDGALLRLGAKFLSADDPDEKKVREVVGGLTGIYVRSYTFNRDNVYSSADVERVRSQIGREYQRIVTVRSKTSENVDVYVIPNGNTARGMVIIAAEPRELTIVQLLGTIDLDKLEALEGEFGIPAIGANAKAAPKATPKPNPAPAPIPNP